MSADVRRTTSSVRLTHVGVGFVVAVVVVALAAINTGNNGLYLVLALLTATFGVSYAVARWNVRGVDVELSRSGEIFANSPLRLEATIQPHGWPIPRRDLVLAVEPGEGDDGAPAASDAATPRRPARRPPPLFVPRLQPKDQLDSALEMMVRRRGLRRLRAVSIRSLFPLGLFGSERRRPIDLELLVYPEIFGASSLRSARDGRWGDEPTARRGAGQDLHALRDYRIGDDPRSIHWKQSARQGELILKERETEESRRLMIVFDNAVGTLETQAQERRFERLVSEAATAALDFLEAGYQVAVVTRSARLGYASGRGQRRSILELLALVEAEPSTRAPLLESDPGTPQLRLAMGVDGRLAEDAA